VSDRCELEYLFLHFNIQLTFSKLTLSHSDLQRRIMIPVRLNKYAKQLVHCLAQHICCSVNVRRRNMVVISWVFPRDAVLATSLRFHLRVYSYTARNVVNDCRSSLQNCEWISVRKLNVFWSLTYSSCIFEWNNSSETTKTLYFEGLHCSASYEGNKWEKARSLILSK
jgi:hypothetical protein